MGTVSYDLPSTPSTPSTPATPSTPSAGSLGEDAPATTTTTPAAPKAEAPKVPAATPAPAPAPVAADRSLAVKIKSTQVNRSDDDVTRIGVACTGDGTCAGKLRVTKVLKLDGVRTRLLLGTADYSIAAGKTAPIALKLTAWGKRILQRDWARLVHVQVSVGQKGTQARRTVAIKRVK